MVETNSGNKAPKDGVVQNISTINLHPGYGTVQAQSATHVLFQNLYAEGGTALRMESGVSDNFKNPVINNEIYGRNIRGKDCNVAVLISPHEVKQGKFDIRDVTGDGCAFAVKLAPGFPEGKRGTYRRNSILRDVKATFGTNAVIDKLNIKYLSCALKDQVVPVEDEVDVKDRMNIGPSVSAVLDVANYKIDFRDSDITQLDGFVEAEKAGTERVVTMEDVGNLKCPS